jgi:hypothetical protein
MGIDKETDEVSRATLFNQLGTNHFVTSHSFDIIALSSTEQQAPQHYNLDKYAQQFVLLQ